MAQAFAKKNDPVRIGVAYAIADSRVDRSRSSDSTV